MELSKATAPVSPPAPPLRTWRPTAAGTAGILLALALAWPLAVIGIDYYRVRQARSVIHDFQEERWGTDEAIQELGGPERALSLLMKCLQRPERSLGEREHAIVLLGGCGRPAVPFLIQVLGNKQEYDDARWAAANALSDIGPDAAEAVPALIAALGNGDDSGGDQVRCNSVMALGSIGPAAQQALPALRRILRERDPDMRKYAAEAIREIQGKKAKK